MEAGDPGDDTQGQFLRESRLTDNSSRPENVPSICEGNAANICPRKGKTRGLKSVELADKPLWVRRSSTRLHSRGVKGCFKGPGGVRAPARGSQVVSVVTHSHRGGGERGSYSERILPNKICC